MDLEVNLNNIKHHHLYRYCLKCFKKFQLPLLTSILFKDLQICPQCTQKLQYEKKLLNSQKQISQIYQFLKLKPNQRLQIFLPHQFRTTTQFCVAGFQGSLPLSHLQQFLGKCQKIRIHNIADMKRHISYLSEAKSPKLNIMFSNITRLQLSNYKEYRIEGQNIDSIEFIQLFDWINLQDLSLWDNNVVYLKSLNKCSFPKLQQIHLSMKVNNKIGHNRINQISQLTRTDFNKLQKISLGNKFVLFLGIESFIINIGFRQSASFQQYKSLLMLSSDRMKTIYLNYLQFIQFYDKSLHHKYPDIHVVSLNNCHYSHGRRNL